MKINELLPQESKFTEVLTTIALVPKMLFYYGKMPENSGLILQNQAEILAKSGKKCQKTSQNSVKYSQILSRNDDIGLEKLVKYGEICHKEEDGLIQDGKNIVKTSRNYGMSEAMSKKYRKSSLEPQGSPYDGRRDKVPPETARPHSDPPEQLKGLRDGITSEEVAEMLASRPKTVAIVGARRYTAYGADIAYRMAYDLASHGVVIVSGMAMGIDSIAHRGALAAGGCTVAVLGTAIDKIYPLKHTGLAREIVEKGGCVMSEYGRGVTTFKTSFLERNRLISALSDIVVVVEATDHSGSLNTATHALEQGRDVFAVPGDVTRPTSVGCNRLIMQGAMPFTCAEDILNVLFPARRERKVRQLPLFGDNMDETAVLKQLGKGVHDGEKIAERAKLDAAKFNQVITMLEIKGRVRGLGANRWALA